MNFQKNGEVLVDVWSKTVIYLHPVHAEFPRTRKFPLRQQMKNGSQSM